MLSRFNPLTRRAPLRSGAPSHEGQKIGKHSGKVRLYGSELVELRRKVFGRSGGRCELRLEGCLGFTGWTRGEMHHVVKRSLGGSDTESNCVWSCRACHRRTHDELRFSSSARTADR